MQLRNVDISILAAQGNCLPYISSVVRVSDFQNFNALRIYLHRLPIVCFYRLESF